MVIGIVILHYKNENDTVACITSLYAGKTSKHTYRVYTVLNEPHPKFAASLTAKFPKIVLLQNQTNVGYAKANNNGSLKALQEGCGAVMLLNNDTIAAVDLVEKLTGFAQTHDQAGVISPKIYFAKGFEYHKDRYSEKEQGRVLWYAGGKIDWQNVYPSHRGVDEVDRGQYDRIEPTGFATGCCMLIKKEVIERIGVMDERYFLYYEDVDYSLRAQKAGFSCMYFPDTMVWHKNASSSGKPGSKIHVYYQTRNRLHFGYTYATLRAKKSLFIESISSIFSDSVKRKAAVDYYLGRMGKADI